MAIFKNGLFHAFSGGLGPIEGYEPNGQLIIRSRRAKPTKPPTAKQMACREKMRPINGVLSRMTPLLQIGFAESAEDKHYNAYGAAVAHNLQHALRGDYPDLQVDYRQLIISQGALPMAELDATAIREGNTIVFSWNAEPVFPHSTDRAMLLAYAPGIQQAVFNLCGNRRDSGQDKLNLPEKWVGEMVHCFLSFRSEIGSQCSNSQYLEKR